ncbi:hypothetical protein EMCRGX_G020251 [Ephydatia muelleri]
MSGRKAKESKHHLLRIGQDHDQEVSDGFATNCCVVLLVILSVVLCVLTFPFSLIFMIRIIPEYQRAVLFRIGRIHQNEAKGPGVFFVLPCLDSLEVVDMRTISFDVPPQQILSKDSVPVHVDAVVYYRVDNPIISITNVVDVGRASRLLAQTQLQSILGGRTLAEILSSRDSIQQQLQQTLDEATEMWGAQVERVEFKDVRLPQTMQRAMAAEAEAAREARAKVVAAQGELNSARALKEAAEVISHSPTALKLRYLQTLNLIATEKSSSIIFPMPIDLAGLGAGLGGGLGNLYGPSEEDTDSKFHTSVLERIGDDVNPRIGPEIPHGGEGPEAKICSLVLMVTSVAFCVLIFPLSLFLIIKASAHTDTITAHGTLSRLQLGVQHCRMDIQICIKVIKEYEGAIRFKLGRIRDNKTQEPGVLLIIPCVEEVVRVDLRTKVIAVPPQEVISKDSVPVHVDAIIYYHISDPIMSVTNVANLQLATGRLAQTLLRNALGIYSLDEILNQRDNIQQNLQHLDEATIVWGVKVERVEFKDVRLPQTMQRAMAAEAEAAREARAKVVAAQGELNSARALKEAAEVISRSPTALKLRYLQTLNVISDEKGSTIIFPMPMDVVGSVGGEPTIKFVRPKDE